MPTRKIVSPVIVVPGITATYLRDDYTLPPETVWSVIRKQYERVALHPDNLRYEASQPARIGPDQIFEIAYKELVSELRHNLADHRDRPVPVYPFGYDWRQPLTVIEAQLSDFIDEVIERTKLLRHYDQQGYAEDPKVNLVGHSMGGLIIAGCIESRGSSAPIDKVATLASPFQGSFEAVLKVVTGTAELGSSPPSSREREAARLTPALYHLVPSFRNGVDAPDFDQGLRLLDRELWQPSVVETIAHFVQTAGLNRRAPRQQAEELFSDLLGEARSHRRRIDRFKLDQAGLTPSDWLCVVGVDAVTRVRLQIERRRGAPEFVLASADRQNLWAKRKTDLKAARFTGDGTVPLEGAIPKFLEERNLVCVTPDDFGYWEIGDRVLTSVAGFHGILPNMDLVHRLIVRHFTGRPDKHKNTWGRAVPGVGDDDGDPAVPLGKPKK